MNADVPTPRLLAAIRSCTDRKDTVDDHTTADNITELRRVQAGEREVMDLLHIDAGHHPWVRLSLEQWACVDGIADALAAARVPAPRSTDTTGGTR